MTELYTGDELSFALAKYKKYKWIIGIVSALWAVLCAVICIWRYNLPYDPNGNDMLQQLLCFAVTVAYFWFLVYFVGLPFRMCRGYVKMYRAVNRGENHPIDAIFMGMEEERTTIDGVDLYGLLFYEGLNKKGRDIIGRVYLDAEKDIEMEIGDKVRYCQKGSFLTAYEIIEKDSASMEDIERMLESLKEHVDMDVVMLVEDATKKKGLRKLEDMELRDDLDSDKEKDETENKDGE
ncbi:MAG: hypothetical protein IKC83_02245 [Clostridia bacterium]|nr:hypothetical protein [Clostridia bacterium]